jgi:hypothetical protein
MNKRGRGRRGERVNRAKKKKKKKKKKRCKGVAKGEGKTKVCAQTYTCQSKASIRQASVKDHSMGWNGRGNDDTTQAPCSNPGSDDQKEE